MKVLASSTLFLFTGLSMVAQGRNGANQGAQQFARNCAGCHGADGKGSDKAPAIATMPNVVAMSDADLMKIVHDGTAAGMPPFAQLGDPAITAVVGYLRTLQGKTPAGAPAAAVTGDANAGRALYFGKAQCSNCHMIEGEGGFIAADLTAYGQSRAANAIQQAIVNPDAVPAGGGRGGGGGFGGGGATARTVEVTTKSGQKLTGVVRSEDNMNLAMQTQDGRYHFLVRGDLAKVTYLPHSLMPIDYGTRLTAKELNDIVSFLIVTGKNAPAEVPPAARGRRGGN